MLLRAPSVPLITVDPYFSVWSPADKLTDKNTCHWTGKPNSMLGLVYVDGKPYRFMGVSDDEVIPQVSIDIGALYTAYRFENASVRVDAEFMTPLLPDDPTLCSRPVSYLKLVGKSIDGKRHEIRFSVSVSEEICLNQAGQYPVVTEKAEVPGLECMRMGSAEQKILNTAGDDIRIDWGYFYLAAKGRDVSVSAAPVVYKGDFKDRRTPVEKRELQSLTATTANEALILFAYDDIESIEYFGARLHSLWNRYDVTIIDAIYAAANGYGNLSRRAHTFSDKLTLDALKAGGEQYADILALAYRQVFAAHKIVVDEDGEMLFISKECFSNGCAATVDVSYPSIPIFLHYNPEFVKGMMRPIFKFAASDEWKFDFAPHDAGKYPLVNRQVYGLRETGYPLETQMPVEECGNMLIMAASEAIAENDVSFAKEHIEVLESWAKYLTRYGQDPENQLCTDDFAGHLAHNCNLSLKAIMGLASLSIIFRMIGDKKKANAYMKQARSMAAVWCKTASNGDGSYKLAFDRPGTFSMKYNAVWDKLFGTGIFGKDVIQSEVRSNFEHFRTFGMPLDDRALYTKTDWMVWTATMLDDEVAFRRYIEPLWNAYNTSSSRVPLTDWYDTSTALKVGFQHRSVQGGLFIKLMEKDFIEKAAQIK